MFVKLFVAVFLAVSSAATPGVSFGSSLATGRSGYEDSPPVDNSTTQHPVSLNDTAKRFPDLLPLWEGNQAFRSEIASSSNPNQLADLVAGGHHPEFLLIGCSDSRTSEGVIFNAPLDSIFVQRNIANQFRPVDNNAISVLSYGVHALGVAHVIVMGHYGCGGVQAAMLPKPNTTGDFPSSSVHKWINPIRRTFLNSNRSEIVSYREANNNAIVEPPEFNNSAFRALVEENVKETVSNVISSPPMRQHWTAYVAQEQLSQNTTNHPVYRRAPGPESSLKAVYVHGLVYDISTGDVTDLGISHGPRGAATEAPPQVAVKRAVDHHVRGHL